MGDPMDLGIPYAPAKPNAMDIPTGDSAALDQQLGLRPPVPYAAGPEQYGDIQGLTQTRNSAGLAKDSTAMATINQDVLDSKARTDAMFAQAQALQEKLAAPPPMRPSQMGSLNTGQLLALGLSALTGGKNNLPGQINQQQELANQQQAQAYQDAQQRWGLSHQDAQRAMEFLQKQILDQQGNTLDLIKERAKQGFQQERQTQGEAHDFQMLDAKTANELKIKADDFRKTLILGQIHYDQDLNLEKNKQRFTLLRDQIVNDMEKQGAKDKAVLSMYTRITDALLSPEGEAQARAAVEALKDPAYAGLPMPTKAWIDHAIQQGKDADEETKQELAIKGKLADARETSANRPTALGGHLPSDEPPQVRTARANIEDRVAKLAALENEKAAILNAPKDPTDFLGKNRARKLSAIGNKIQSAKAMRDGALAKYKALTGHDYAGNAPLPLSGAFKLKNGTIITPIN
jgi:hypothetical protein